MHAPAHVTLAGCPACAENVQNFWCNYVCSPNQTFVEILGVKEVPDPENAPNIATVLEVNVLVDKASACSLFASCADTTYVHEDAALGDCQGFLRFQGQTEALGHGNDINFIFTNSSTPPNAPRMFLDNLSCANYTLPGANTSAACDCSVCSAACTAADVVPVKVKVLQVRAVCFFVHGNTQLFFICSGVCCLSLQLSV